MDYALIGNIKFSKYVSFTVYHFMKNWLIAISQKE